MSKPKGRTLPISPYRRSVAELMHFSQQVPAVTAERRMDLSPLIAARASAAVRSSWTVIFSKAFAMLGRDYPVLRQSFMKFPWARIYEHPHSIAALNIERRLPTEDIVIFCLISRPENRTLAEMDAKVRYHRETPVEQLRCYIRSERMGKLPWPTRRHVWWASVNMFGRRRCHNFGTFSVSSIASHGAGLLTVVPLLTSAIHYSLFEGSVLPMRMTFDHRVMDGATVARVLTDFEQVLNRELVKELTGGGTPLRIAA